MSVRRKNQRALRRLRSRGVPIAPDFSIPEEWLAAVPIGGAVMAVAYRHGLARSVAHVHPSDFPKAEALAA